MIGTGGHGLLRRQDQSRLFTRRYPAGERTLGYESRIEPVRRFKAGKDFIKNSVVGLGLHQGLEYLLGRNIWATIGQSRLAFSRLYNSIKVLRRSKVYRYYIGHDIEKNELILLDFLDSLDL